MVSFFGTAFITECPLPTFLVFASNIKITLHASKQLFGTDSRKQTRAGRLLYFVGSYIIMIRNPLKLKTLLNGGFPIYIKRFRDSEIPCKTSCLIGFCKALPHKTTREKALVRLSGRNDGLLLWMDFLCPIT